MSKIRNSLGVLVLPFIPELIDGDSITWSEYKERTGIDLERVFSVSYNTEDSVYQVRFKKETTKILATSLQKEDSVVPQIMIASSDFGDSSQAGDSHVVLGHMGRDNTGYVMSINGNKTITFSSN